MKLVTLENIIEAESNLVAQSFELLEKHQVNNVQECHRQYQLYYNNIFGSPKKYGVGGIRYRIARHKREDFVLRTIYFDYEIFN